MVLSEVFFGLIETSICPIELNCHWRIHRFMDSRMNSLHQVGESILEQCGKSSTMGNHLNCRGNLQRAWGTPSNSQRNLPTVWRNIPKVWETHPTMSRVLKYEITVFNFKLRVVMSDNMFWFFITILISYVDHQLSWDHHQCFLNLTHGFTDSLMVSPRTV